MAKFSHQQVSKSQDVSPTIIDWMAWASSFTASSIIIYLVVNLESAYYILGIVWRKVSYIHSDYPISVFLKIQFHWIFNVCDKSIWKKHQSKVSGDFQNQWSMPILSRHLAKTSSQHSELKFRKNTCQCTKYPDIYFWSTSKVYNRFFLFWDSSKKCIFFKLTNTKQSKIQNMKRQDYRPSTKTNIEYKQAKQLTTRLKSNRIWECSTTSN